jgi:alpha-amylase
LRALSFFEKDSIQFHAFARSKFYKTLLDLRKRDPALDADAAFTRLSVGDDRAVYSFLREKSGHRLLVLLNLSKDPQAVKIGAEALKGNAIDVFSGKTVTINSDKWTLEPWGYRVLEY